MLARGPARRPRTSFLFTRARSSTEVPFELTRTVEPGSTPSFFASALRELDLRPGPLKLQLGHSFHRGAGEERAVGQQAQALALSRPLRGGRRRRRLDVGRPGRQRGVLPIAG